MCFKVFKNVSVCRPIFIYRNISLFTLYWTWTFIQLCIKIEQKKDPVSTWLEWVLPKRLETSVPALLSQQLRVFKISPLRDLVNKGRSLCTTHGAIFREGARGFCCSSYCLNGSGIFSFCLFENLSGMCTPWTSSCLRNLQRRFPFFNDKYRYLKQHHWLSSALVLWRQFGVSLPTLGFGL